jgi:hypothetical protein
MILADGRISSFPDIGVFSALPRYLQPGHFACSIGISFLISRATNNVHLTASACNALFR